MMKQVRRDQTRRIWSRRSGGPGQGSVGQRGSWDRLLGEWAVGFSRSSLF